MKIISKEGLNKSAFLPLPLGEGGGGVNPLSLGERELNQSFPKPVRISERQRGFTLLEVLIAVLLLAVGLLGLAGLQAVSLRNNHSAYLRSQATMLTYDIIDSMRSNRNAAQAANYDIAMGPSVPTLPPDFCTTNDCSGQQMATFEVESWKQSLANLLPSGDGAIARAGSVVTVTVQWTDDRDPANPTRQFMTSTEL